jgi:saccharopine dehydrogenase (NADP+, L-glutamate forming)
MKRLLVLGAGRSSSALISYLLRQAAIERWEVVVGDASLSAARERVGNSEFGSAVHFDLNNKDEILKAIRPADVVISLIPPQFHPAIASYCIAAKTHLLTASYVSREMRDLQGAALQNNVLLLNECGLDPGIDHMSAMQLIDKIHLQGGKLKSFESFTGGLIAPETDPENPWRYKFTWNPHNVVMAGQGTAKFLDEGKLKYISYQQLFRRITTVSIPGLGDFEGYANRDSLGYIETYGLKHIQTMVRGTLRNQGFCAAWDLLVQMGCTEDTHMMESSQMTHGDFINSFLPVNHTGNVEEKVLALFQLNKNGAALERLRWSGLFNNELIGLDRGTPAQILEHILNKRWKLQPEDKDMIVMWHRFKYELDGEKREIQASLTAVGEDSVQTAMAKTVGLPLGIAAKRLLQSKIAARGVIIPTIREIYDPVMAELEQFDIRLTENEILV